MTGLRNGRGELRCFDAGEGKGGGKLLWKADYGPEWDRRIFYPGARGTPSVHDGRVYVLSGFGALRCFDAATGEQQWGADVMERFGGRNVMWGLAESLLIDGDRLYVAPGGPEASVVALHRLTGETLWVAKELSDRSAYCSPIVFDRGDTRVLCTALERRIVGLEAKTGKLLWSHPWVNTWKVNANTPIHHEGKVYVTSGYGRGSVVLQLSEDGRAATVVWQKKLLDCFHHGVVRVGDLIIGSSNSRPRGRLMSLVLATGEVRHQTRTGDASLIAADGRLYVYLASKGELRLYEHDPEKGFVVHGRLPIGAGTGEHWAHPSIANGRLYVRHGEELLVFDIRAGQK